jgi:hypothetical protein
MVRWTEHLREHGDVYIRVLVRCTALVRAIEDDALNRYTQSL